MNQPPNLVFTLCSNNYLAQAATLGDTLLKFNPDLKFLICLVDRRNNSFDYSKIPHDIIEVENIGIPCLSEMILRYNIVELNTAFKPYFFQYFFNTTTAESIIYLDPDIQVFAPLVDLHLELSKNDIVITPHFTTPINDDKWQAEEDFLNSGLYNLGFIAIKKSSNSIRMLDWWAERMRTKAYINFKKGLFTDQIWINFVPLFFEKVKIFINPGYNVAYWNLHERVISIIDEMYYVNGKQQLIFYHYASFKPLNPDQISTGQSRYTFKDRPDILPLFQNYCELVFQNNYKSLAHLPCYYVGIRENVYRQQIDKKIKKIPKYKRAIGRIVRWVIRRFNIVMDYSTLN